MKRPLTYLATPYSHPDSGIRQDRFLSVTKVAAEMMASGEHVYSPISHCHPIALAGNLPKNFDYWREYCITMMRCCTKLKVLMVPGWRESVGVDAEIAIAKHLNIPVEYIQP